MPEGGRGPFLKVILPVRKGDYAGRSEGIWAYVVIAEDDQARTGIGVLANKPFEAEWAGLGDLVAWTSPVWDGAPAPNMRPVVVDARPCMRRFGYDRLVDRGPPPRVASMARSWAPRVADLLRAEAPKMIVTLCARCGKPANLFRISDEEWDRVVPEPLHDKVVCRPCFDELTAARPPLPPEITAAAAQAPAPEAPRQP